MVVDSGKISAIGWTVSVSGWPVEVAPLWILGIGTELGAAVGTRLTDVSYPSPPMGVARFCGCGFT